MESEIQSEPRAIHLPNAIVRCIVDGSKSKYHGVILVLALHRGLDIFGALCTSLCGSPVTAWLSPSVFKSLNQPQNTHTSNKQYATPALETTTSFILGCSYIVVVNMLCMSLSAGAAAATPMCISRHACTDGARIAAFANANDFPSFLPKQVENVKDLFARKMASRIQRLPVEVKFIRCKY